MKTEVLSVYDSKARAFVQPWFAVNLAVAARSFADAVNDPTQVVYRNPEDFTLYHLGSFDDNTGRFDQLEQPVNLGMGVNFKETGHVRKVA